jgi:hypothetical protein
VSGDSFASGAVLRRGVETFKGPAVFFRAAFRAFRNRRMRNFIYTWVGTLTDSDCVSGTPAGRLTDCASDPADIVLRMDTKGGTAASELLVWTHRDVDIVIDPRGMRTTSADCGWT